MTVAVQTPEISYIENGSTTAFPVPFRYDSPADLRAIRRAADGTETVLVNGVDFTATIGSTNAGGTLTTTAAATTGTRLTIWRDTARAQTADYIANGAFTAESHERALDKAMLVNQEQDAQLLRSVLTPRGEPAPQLPAAVNRSGKIFAFDSAGNAVLDIDADKVRQIIAAIFAPVFTQLASLVLFIAGAVGAITRSVQDKLRDTVSVKDFGAVGDGITDDTAAIQAAIDAVDQLGGEIIFPPGRYLVSAPITINRTYAGLGGGLFVGERNLLVTGYGAEIRTTGAITAFEVRGGWLPNHNFRIEGFTIYHRGNPSATGGVRIIGAGLVTCKDISVVVDDDLPVTYAAFSCENSDPADVDTGCFWNVFDHCSIRPWAGAEGVCAFGIRLIGTANATTVRGCTLSGSQVHVSLEAHNGQIGTPNSVLIDGNFFEGPIGSIGIRLVGASAAGVYHVTGCRIVNNRFENVGTVVSLEGTGAEVQVPLYMAGNYADTTITYYIDNPLGVAVNVLDSGLVGSADQTKFQLINQRGAFIEAKDSLFDPLTVRSANVGTGVALERSDGTFVGRWRYASFAGGIGTLLGGTKSPAFRPFGVVGCEGISKSDTAANNLVGSLTLNGTTSTPVNFPVAEPNATYEVFLSTDSNVTVWVASKTASGFTIGSSAASTARVAWFLVRTG